MSPSRPGHRVIDPMPFINRLGGEWDWRLPVRPLQGAPDGWPEGTPSLAIGDNPEFTTSAELVPVSSLPIWDVNGYYRLLGIQWPFRPTRKELGLAYQRVEGYRDERITYAFKRLINPELRRVYDRRPLGKPMDDYYRWKEIEQLAVDWLSEQNARLGPDDEVLTMDDYMRDLGMPTLKEMEEQVRAEAMAEAEERSTSSSDGRVTGDWRWGFYLLNSVHADTDVLERWQALLVAACVEQGLRVKLTLGYVGDSSEPWLIRSHRQHTIIFFHDDTQTHPPSRATAESIVTALTTQEHR